MSKKKRKLKPVSKPHLLFTKYTLNIALQRKPPTYVATAFDRPPYVGRDPIMVRLRDRPMLYRHYYKNRYFYREIRHTLVGNFPDFLFFISFSFLTWFFFLFFLPLFKYCCNYATSHISISIISFVLGLLDFFYSTARVIPNFFNFILNHITYDNGVFLQLIPEIILLSGVTVILLVQSWANQHYNVDFFKRLFVRAFGQQKLEFLESSSYSARSFGLYLGRLKQLRILSYSWNIAFTSVLFAMLWLMYNTVDTVHDISLNLLVTSDQFSFIGLNDILFGNHFYYDNFVFYSRFFILLVSLIFLLIFKNEINLDFKSQKVEFLILSLLGVFFSILMVAAASLLSLFLVIEGLVMVMYVLSAGGSLSSIYPISKIIRFRATEGSLKYVIVNAVAASFFLIGSVLILLFTNGELYFLNLNSILSLDNPSGFLSLYSQAGILCGLLFIASTFLFKIGSIPFHAWMADLYESSTLGVLTFFVLIPKMAILLTLINLHRFLFIHFPFVFFIFFLVTGLISLIVGAIMASKQVKISRLIAYSSVSQVGSLLVLLSLIGLNPNIPYVMVMLFIISYALVMSHFMSILTSIKRSPSLLSISLLKELPFIRSLPLGAQTVFAMFIFNLSGMPPFLGWLLKSSVLFVSILLAFDSFTLVNDSNSFLSIFSNLELSCFSYFFDNFSSAHSHNFMANLIFLFLIVLSIIIFAALIVSIHYSIQLYKVTFSEFNNLSSDYSVSMGFNYSVPALMGSFIFVISVINLLSFFGILGIFSWLQFACFSF
jgi:NADH-quinone oxidoreductase subunit N